MRRVAIALAVLGLATVTMIVPPRTAVAADTVAAAGDVELYLSLPASDPRHTFLLHLYPLRGIAVAMTEQGNQLTDETFLRNAYAMKIPKEPFDGSIDLNFPGVGEVVGTVDLSQANKPELPSKACEYRSPGIASHFEGRIRFPGASGYAPWAGRKAEAAIGPGCAPSSTGKSEGEELFGALAEFGPTLPGPVGFRFFAHARPPGRVVEFITFGDHQADKFFGTFAAIDREWLSGDIATERVVSTPTKTISRSVEVGPGGAHPDRIAFAPPAPFFGHATYLRRTGKLRGSIGVRFLGRKLRLAQRPMSAKVEDEDHPWSERVGPAL
jgi:hypothetical protein